MPALCIILVSLLPVIWLNRQMRAPEIMNLLTLRSVTKCYTATDPPAVGGVSFECAQGRSSTHRRQQRQNHAYPPAGLEIPDAGEVMLNGTTNLPTRFVPPRSGIAVWFFRRTLFPNKTVSQNISFGKSTDDPAGSVN